MKSRITGFLCATILLSLAAPPVFAQSGSLKVGAAGTSAQSGIGTVSGRRYAARQGQSHEVVLPDGTNVVIGAGGSFVAERFEWTGKAGGGRLRLGPGTYRISAGALGRSGDLEVFAGTTRLVIEDATAVVNVAADGSSSAYMAVGGRVTVSAGGRCARRLSRPGFVTTASSGGCPSRAVRVSGSAIAEDRRALRPVRHTVAATSANANRAEETSIFVPAAGQTGGGDGDGIQAAPTERALGDGLANARNEQTETAPVTTPVEGTNITQPTKEPTRPQQPQPPRGPGPGLGDDISLALSFAPGVDVAGGYSVNVSGASGSQADGRFVVEGSSVELELRSFVLFPSTAATDVFFSNSDTEPIVPSPGRGGAFPEPPGVTSLGYSSSDFENLYRVGLYGLDSFDDEGGPFTVGDAIGEGLGPENGYEDYEALLDDPDSGVSSEDIIGFRLNTAYHAVPQFNGRATEFANAFSLNFGFGRADPLPFGNGFAAAFSSAADNSREENTFAASNAFEAVDGFVLYHFTQDTNASLEDFASSYIFATGTTAADAPALRSFRIDRFDASFGLFDLVEAAEDGGDYLPRRALLSDITRARVLFGTPESRVPLSNPGIHLVYAPQNTDRPTGDVAQFAYGDIGFSGSGSKQFSTLSIATGLLSRLQYEASTTYPNPEYDINQEVSETNPQLIEDPLTRSRYALTIEARGSRRDNPADPADREDGEYVGSEMIYSFLNSSSYGGGNPEQRSDPDTPLRGVPGYFLLEGRGNVIPLDSAGSGEEFQTVRLLRGTGSVSEETSGSFATNGSTPPEFDFAGRDQPAEFSGYAAGLAESASDANGIGISQRGSGPEGRPNLSIVTTPLTNRLSANVTLIGRDGFSASFALGDLNAFSSRLSAYVDRSRFAALSFEGIFALASSAFVLGETVEVDGQQGRRIPGLGSEAGTFVRDYQHVKWGVFLGDRIAVSAENDGGRMDMGTWVAGDPVDASQYNDFTGTATYTGHAIGNAFDGTATYTAIGTYTNTWTFNGRDNSRGSVQMTFDNSTYTGDTSLKAGGGFASTNLEAPGRVGSLDGDFFGGVSTDANGRSPNAVGGQFDLSNAPDAATYRASGTFAAEK